VTVDITGAFRILSWGAHTTLFTINIPLTISATILIAFYWFEFSSFSSNQIEMIV
jgi:hypothetical protein